jgi:hypothetical protein
MENTQQANTCSGDEARGPGLVALYEAHAAWHRSNQPSGPPPWRMPLLAMERHNDGAVVTDTRDCALSPRCDLSAIEVSLLDLADAAPPLDNLRITMRSQYGLSDEEIDSVIQRLLQARFLVLVDGRAISLVLDHPVPPRLRVKDQPTGYIKVRSAQASLNQALELAFAG